MSNGTIGLSSIGNTCFLNAALQNLKNSFILTKNLLVDCGEINFSEFTSKYRLLLANLINQENEKSYAPYKFYQELTNSSPLFSYGQQNDSNISIIYILDKLANDFRNFKPLIKVQYCAINCLKNSFYDKLELEKYNEFLQKYEAKKRAPIIDNFYGIQEDIYKCENQNCDYVSYTFQIFTVLNLPIVTKNLTKINSLKESIRYFQEKNYYLNVKNFDCKKCHHFNISTQSILISLPKILIVNFKRVGEQNFYSHNLEIPSKLESQEIAIDYCNLYTKYEMTGFIKHYGGGNFGHNIAICKNFFDGIWYEYDDSRVRSIFNTRNVDNKNPDFSNGFLFFYEMKDHTTNNSKDFVAEIEQNAKEFRLKSY